MAVLQQILGTDLTDIDEKEADYSIRTIDLSADHSAVANYQVFTLEKPAVGFELVTGPTTGIFKIHPRKPGHPPLDLTVIDKHPVFFKSFYIENDAHPATTATIIFLHRLDLLFVLTPTRAIGLTQVAGVVSVSGVVNISGTVAISGVVSISGTVTIAGTVAVSGTVVVSNSGVDTLVSISTQRTAFATYQYTLSAGVVKTGDNVVCPNGFNIFIWADNSNSDEIAFAGDVNPVVGTNASLKPGNGLPLQIDNLNRIRFITSTTGQKINCMVIK